MNVKVERKRKRLKLHDVIFIMFISWVVIYADFKITKANMGSKFCGIGCIPYVLRGESQKPMQYRVLVPWLCKMVDGVHDDFIKYLDTYFIIRCVSITLSMFSCWVWFSCLSINPLMGIMLMALFYIFAMLYDYTDIYIEVFFFSLAFTVMTIRPDMGWLILLVIGFISGLNRETALFIPFTMLLCGYPLMELAPVTFFTVWGIIVPIVKYGDKERYCSFLMFSRNIKNIRELFKKSPPILLNDYIKFFAIFVVTTYLYVATICTTGLSPIDISMGVLFILLLVPSVWKEIRVFTPTMLAVIPMALRGLN